MTSILTGNFGKSLLPGVRTWVGMGYEEYPLEFLQIFEKYTSNRAFEEDVGTYGLGLGMVIPEGAPMQYDTMAQTFVARYTQVKYGLGFKISLEAKRDNQYMELAQKQGLELGKSMRQLQENVAANILNYAFTNTSSHLGMDGQPLCSSGHLLGKGGTYSNTPALGSDISEFALEQALIAIAALRDDSNRLVAIRGDKIIIPPGLEFEVMRILGSALQNDTANNALNALKTMGMLPGGVVVNHYLTDPDAYFIKTTCSNGLKYFENMPLETDTDMEFDTRNTAYLALLRCAFGWTDARCIYGNPGA